ncbi:MAG: DNA-packaging protein [Candidatus Dormibacteria bacterium]
METLTKSELAALRYDWTFWSRCEQRLPPGDWNYWLIMAGRGWGKTRTGAETVRQWVRTNRYVNLIGATADDARDIMIEGESGILEICPSDERPEYKPSKRKLFWPNGAESLIFTADEPERLRGKQHQKLLCDELSAWRYAESWDQAKFGSRLGQNPQVIITTTPRPTEILREIMSDPATVITRGTTHDNSENLAKPFLSSILRRYEGTRLGRQEIYGELLDDNPHALFRRSDIDAGRIKEAPPLTRIVVAIDPAATSGEESDETGIICAGLCEGHGYVLDDHSLRASPMGWARKAVLLLHERNADRILAEVNNGGEMVISTIKSVDPNVPTRSVTASRGKAVRAEPVAALYEQHRIHHVGSFPVLEDQMCDFDPLNPSGRSPDRMDALVWAITDLMLGEQTTGLLDFMRNAQERARPQEPAVRTTAGIHVNG